MNPYYQDEHVTLYHADCLQHLDMLDQADVLITDPPYGSEVLSNGYGRTFKKIKNDSTTEYRDKVLELFEAKPALVFGSPRLPEPPGDWDHRLVWDKRQPGLGDGAWRYQHESIFVRGKGWHKSSNRNFSIMQFSYENSHQEKKAHVHAKPVRLMESLVNSAPKGLIIDPFAGSGSTLRAAKNLGRKAIGFEIEEKYCDIIAQRCAQETLGIF